MSRSISRHPSASTSRGAFVDAIVILTLVVVFFFSRMEFNLPVTADDMFFGYFDEPLRNLAIANRVNGRFVSGAFVHVFEFLNAWHFEFLYVCKILTILLFCTFAYVYCHLITGGASLVALFIASLIIILHPYNTTNFDNIINQPNMLFAVGATTLAVWAFARTRSVHRFVLCFALLLIVASSYQTIAYYFFVFVIAYSLFQAKSENEIAKTLLLGAAISATSIITYFVIHKLLLPDALAAVRASGEPLMIQTFLTHRSDVKAPADILQSLGTYGEQLIRSFAAPEPIFMSGQKAFVAIALGLPMLVWMYQQARQGSLLSSMTRWRIYLILLLLLLCGSVIHVVLQQTEIPPRSLMHASTVMASVFLFGYLATKLSSRPYVLALGASVAILMGWLTIEIATDRQELWRRDIALTQKVVDGIKHSGSVSDDTAVAVVGRMRENALHMNEIGVYFNVNLSKFTSTWSLVPMLSAVMGKRLKPADRIGHVEATRRCLQHQPINEPYLILKDGSNVMLCLQHLKVKSPHL